MPGNQRFQDLLAVGPIELSLVRVERQIILTAFWLVARTPIGAAFNAERSPHLGSFVPLLLPYQNHLLYKYKLYVEMVLKLSERRQSGNSFFVIINTALIAFLGLVASPDVGSDAGVAANPPLPWVLAVCASGVVLCYTWYLMVHSYQQLNHIKFTIVNAIESRLPVSPFAIEWNAVGRGEKR